ncbi:sulfatase [Virgibacillus halodenitrificans]|uniref:sulfatase family protein n=1 Tax=Virgibacillus halodenitrificans TaxID=1482 RepID=UPI0024BFAC00|nr:sulfatase [Virgibacillus halodenitrificans]WHX26557.1 sulfatase [Virgibacillus halodenitrificans]
MTRKPNIVYLFADQWRRQAVGYANEDPVITPNMDQFAKESVVFTQAVSCSPLCSPHRASMLTGKYPMGTGVYTNCKVGADVMLQPNEICISDVLKQAGYRTGYIGKWHLDLPEKNISDNPTSGAEGWDAFTPPGPKRHGFDYWYSYGAWDDHLAPHYWEDTPEKIQIKQWSVKHETDKAIEYIREQNETDPFALFVSWNPPHSPFDDVPEKYKQVYENNIKDDFRKNVNKNSFMVHTGEEVEGGPDQLAEKRKNYFAAITGIDENFGRILQVLQEENLEENTIVVLTADHGEMMGSHGLMAKHVWYEESIGVPFCIRWPGEIKPDKTDALLNTVDIMPTLLQLADLDIPATVEGNDLSPVLESYTDGPDKTFLCAYPGRKEAIENFEQHGLNNLAYGWRAVRSVDNLYVIHRGYAPGEETVRLLYDLKKDPDQLNPQKIINSDENELIRELEQSLFTWLSKQGDPFMQE